VAPARALPALMLALAEALLGPADEPIGATQAPLTAASPERPERASGSSPALQQHLRLPACGPRALNYAHGLLLALAALTARLAELPADRDPRCVNPEPCADPESSAASAAASVEGGRSAAGLGAALLARLRAREAEAVARGAHPERACMSACAWLRVARLELAARLASLAARAAPPLQSCPARPGSSSVLGYSSQLRASLEQVRAGPGAGAGGAVCRNHPLTPGGPINAYSCTAHNKSPHGWFSPGLAADGRSDRVPSGRHLYK
jgi:hypothetical protein